MKMKNTIVLVEDFNIDILREAFRQGRLYIRTEAKSAKSIREEGIQAILQYVSRIHACAYQAYAPTIHQLWEAILHSPELGDLFFRERGGAAVFGGTDDVIDALVEQFTEAGKHIETRHTFPCFPHGDSSLGDTERLGQCHLRQPFFFPQLLRPNLSESSSNPFFHLEL